MVRQHSGNLNMARMMDDNTCNQSQNVAYKRQSWPENWDVKAVTLMLQLQLALCANQLTIAKPIPKIHHINMVCRKEFHFGWRLSDVFNRLLLLYCFVLSLGITSLFINTRLQQRNINPSSEAFTHTNNCSGSLIHHLPPLTLKLSCWNGSRSWTVINKLTRELANRLTEGERMRRVDRTRERRCWTDLNDLFVSSHWRENKSITRLMQKGDDMQPILSMIATTCSEQMAPPFNPLCYYGNIFDRMGGGSKYFKNVFMLWKVNRAIIGTHI